MELKLELEIRDLNTLIVHFFLIFYVSSSPLYNIILIILLE